MKEDIKNRWIDALKSGKYKQFDHRLKSGDGSAHCCLGVLCELAVEDGIIRTVGHGLYLDQTVMEWAEMSDNSAKFPDPEVKYPANCLAALNDKGYSFEQIAEIIEEKWKVL